MSLNDSYFPTRFTPSWRFKGEAEKKFFYKFCVFCLVVACLELGQDLISSQLNQNPFQWGESLAYKMFWLLFIPFSLILAYGISKTREYFADVTYYIYSSLLVLIITLTHLILFSFFLFGTSNLIHENPWSLTFLIIEKFSTRLYIGFTIYIVLSVLYTLLKRKEAGTHQPLQKYSKTVTVKNGQRSVLVDTGEIKWISSDGPYLFIHTSDKKHVVLDSLKNMISTLPENFKRIHRSTIVNTDKIKELKSRGNGDYDVTLNDNQVLRLSRNYSKPLKRLLF